MVDKKEKSNKAAPPSCMVQNKEHNTPWGYKHLGVVEYAESGNI